LEKNLLESLPTELINNNKLLKEICKNQEAQKQYFLDIWEGQNHILEKMEIRDGLLITISKELALLKLNTEESFKEIEKQLANKC